MSKKINTSELDEFHYHEMLDRLHTINSVIDNFLSEHPVAAEHSEINKLIDEASNNLAKAYQITGLLSIKFTK